MSRCAQCQAPFTCAMNDQTGTRCWCADMPPLPVRLSPAAMRELSCLCPDCLRRKIEQQTAAINGKS